MFSLEGVALLFVRRSTGKEFGPFPTDKIKSLVKQGKVAADEFVSQDRETWYPVNEVKEFIPILGEDAVIELPLNAISGGGSDLPGLKSSGGGSDLPGLKSSGGGSDLPGLKSSGGSSDLPGLKGSSGSPDLPGLKIGTGSDLPGVKPAVSLPDLPGVKEPAADLPTDKSMDFPGIRQNLPGVKGATKADLPGHHDNLVTTKGSTEYPGVPTSLPGVKSNPDLPELPNLPGSKAPAAASPASGDDDAGMGIELDLDGGGLFDEAAEAPSLGVFELEEDPSDNSLSMDSFSEDVTKPLELMDSSSSLDDPEEELPAFITAVEKDKARSFEDEDEITPVGGSPLPLILGLVVLLAALFGAEYFFNFTGLLRSKKKPSPAPQVKVVTKKGNNTNIVKKPVKVPTKEKTRLPLFYISRVKLEELTKTKNRALACQAALVLAWHHNEGKPLSLCKYLVAKRPKVSSSSVHTVNDLFRLMILAGTWDEKTKKALWSGPTIKDPLISARSIISRSLSRQRKSPLWNMMAALESFAAADYVKAKSHFEVVKTQESDGLLAINYHLAALGDPESLSQLQKVSPPWAALAKAASVLYLREKRGLFLPSIEAVPALDVASYGTESEFGKRLRARALALSALSAWFTGNVKRGFENCEKGAMLDREDSFTGSLCMELWIYHGLYGNIRKFYSKVKKPWVDLYNLLYHFSNGKSAKGVALWLDFKTAKSPNYVLTTPFKVSFSLGSEKSLLESLDKAYAVAPGTTAKLLLLLVQMRALPVTPFLGLVQKWQKEDKSGVTKDLMALLTIWDTFSMEKHKEVETRVKALTLASKGAYVPYAALRAISLKRMGQKEQAIKSLSLFPDAAHTTLGLSAQIEIATGTPEIKQYYTMIERMVTIIRDPLFYSSAANAYLYGERKDRLLRAKFFIDKILRLSPDSFESKILMGRILLESGKFDQGERLMKEIIGAKKATADDLFAWVDLEIRLRRFGPAMDALEAGAERFPKDARIPFKRAEIYMGRNDPEKALKYLKKIKQPNTVGGKYYLLVGLCHQKLRNRRQAEKAFAMAVKKSPESPSTNFYYGKVLITNNRVRRSTKYLEKAINLELAAQKNVKNYKKSEWLSKAHYLLGGAYKELGNRKKAAVHFRAFAQMVPPGPLKDEAMRLLRSIGAN